MNGLGAAGSVVGLLGAALSTLNVIRNLNDSLKDWSTTLSNISAELVDIEDIFQLVRAEDQLKNQTLYGGLEQIYKILVELREYHRVLEANTKKPGAWKFLHALNDGGKEDEKLKSILGRLRSAREGLAIRIQVVMVGLMGSQRDGFKVAVDIVMRVDAHVKMVLGEGLKIARVLEQRRLVTTDVVVKVIEITVDEKNAIEAAVYEKTVPRVESEARGERFRVNNVRLGDDARFMEGDVGFQSPPTGPGQRAVMENVTFGNGAFVQRGHIAQAVGSDFIKAFWVQRP